MKKITILNIFVYIIIVLLIMLITHNDNSIIFLGIKASDIKGDVDFRSVGQWTLVLIPIILTVGYHVDESLKLCTLTLYRYGETIKWYIDLSRTMVFQILFYIITVFSLSLILYEDVQIKVLIISVILIFFNFNFWVCLWEIFRYLFKNSIYATLTILLMVGLGYVICEEISLSPLISIIYWGMYERSSICNSGGFNIVTVILIQILFIILMKSIIVAALRKNKNLLFN